ncbi:MAG: Tim44/TimA family putative adaptor protein [Holosporales bacterium]
MGPLIEILFWAIVAAFVLWRLYSVLGEKTGHFMERPDPSYEEDEEPHVVRATPKNTEDQLDPRTKEVVDVLKSADPSFDLTEFCDGAAAAFEMIVHAVAKEDFDTLKHLLSPALYEEFAEDIRQRQQRRESLEVILVRLEPLEMLSASMKGAVAKIQVKITSEQIHLLRNEQGQVIEGDSQQSLQVEDLWTFERDTRSSDPNWRLVEAESA